jgi:hypothetical protein
MSNTSKSNVEVSTKPGQLQPGTGPGFVVALSY